MILVNYALSENPLLLREQKKVDLAKADLVDLCYSCFGGDLTLKVNDIDFSIITGGGVQILDFAVELFSACRSLTRGKVVQVDFAGMSDEIYLKRSGESVEMSSNYADGHAQIVVSELKSASRKFLFDVLVDLEERHPELKKNRNLKRVRYWVGLRA